MRLFKGEQVTVAEFFELITSDKEFFTELGRVILAAGRLESIFMINPNNNGPTELKMNATVRLMIKYAEKHSLLTDLIPQLLMLKTQRYHFTHNT